MVIHQDQQKRRVSNGLWAVALGLGLLGGTADAADCLDAGESITEINRLLLEVELEAARDLAVRAQQDLLCQTSPVNTLVLSSLFDAVAASQFFLEEEAQATLALERSLAVNPSRSVDARYGTQLEERYEELKAERQDLASGGLSLVGRVSAWVDGRPVPMNTRIDVAAGSHLLQWRHEDGELENRFVDVGPEEFRSLQLGEVDLSQRRILLASGGGLLATSAVLLVLAGQRYQEFEAYGDDYESHGDDTPQSSTLDDLYQKNHVLAISGVGCGVAGLGLLGAGAIVANGRLLFTVSGHW